MTQALRRRSLKPWYRHLSMPSILRAVAFGVIGFSIPNLITQNPAWAQTSPELTAVAPWKEIIYIHQCPEHWQELVTLSQDQHLEWCGNFSPEWPLLDPNLLDTVSNDIAQVLKREFFAPPHEQLKTSER